MNNKFFFTQTISLNNCNIHVRNTQYVVSLPCLTTTLGLSSVMRLMVSNAALPVTVISRICTTASRDSHLSASWQSRDEGLGDEKSEQRDAGAVGGVHSAEPRVVCSFPTCGVDGVLCGHDVDVDDGNDLFGINWHKLIAEELVIVKSFDNDL